MSEIAKAVTAIEHQIGHHTAHLDLDDQITATLEVARLANGMCSDLIKERALSRGEKP